MTSRTDQLSEIARRMRTEYDHDFHLQLARGDLRAAHGALRWAANHLEAAGEAASQYAQMALAAVEDAQEEVGK